MSSGERGRLTAMAFAVIALNLGGWGLFAEAVHQGRLATLGLGLGVAFTAWTLGMRHAFDADHISAIDNTTRKLMADGKRPLSTGFFFALGHSSIVVAVAVGIMLATRVLFDDLLAPDSSDKMIAGLVGTIIAVTFLYLIAALNLVGLSGMSRALRKLRRGEYDEAALEQILESRGLLYRVFRPLMRSITRPGHMYVVGVLFGIGFDTSTEVVLLTTTASSASVGLPWYAVLSMPLLFAGGMTLFDTLDGCFMNFAYGWAFAKPVRKIFYNLAITALSIAVALLVGTVELFGLIADQFHLRHGIWGFLGAVDINLLGIVIVGIFVAAWAVAATVWKFGKFDQRWEIRSASDLTSSAG
ncbi:HoxN/HupN/NixA family nickel/cobalt transporter [Streptomyces tremellae]|uniref:Nickel/cobalt efflux system n=1 Tax=Streptomyces tremellae TaxID=1124239 RepID=A0ABP7FSU2_9ACTN